jgi:hypothetical protein
MMVKAMTTKSMRVWTGRLRLLGEATRGNSRRPGPEVEARIILGDVHDDLLVQGEPRLTVEISREPDRLGQHAWKEVAPEELTPESLCRALVLAAGTPAGS